MTTPARPDEPYRTPFVCVECSHVFHPYACRERVDGARCQCGSAS